MIKKLIIFYFTPQGKKLAEELGEKELGEEVTLFQGTSKEIIKLLKSNWQPNTAFLFIGAMGIAVRLIAPLVKDKLSDPAVIVADEKGKYFISVLAGHYGGANEICKLLAQTLGGEAVITTATDVQGKVGLDVLAKKYGLKYDHRDVFKVVNSALVRGEEVNFYAKSLPLDFPYPFKQEGEKEFSGIKVVISPYVSEKKLREYQLYPPAIWVGVGCRRGVSLETLETAIFKALEKAEVSILGVAGISSIDLKKEEKAILDFSFKYKLKTKFFSGEELLEVIAEKKLNQSTKVLEKIGVGNVCEAAALKAVTAGELILPKTKFPQVTVALAENSVWWE